MKKVIRFLMNICFFCSVHFPAVNICLYWDDYKAPYPNIKVWLLIGTLVIDFILVQWRIYLRTWPLGTQFFNPLIRKVLMMLTIPTFGVLLYSLAVVSDSDYSVTAPNYTRIFKYMNTLLTLISTIYGLYIFILVTMTLSGSLNSMTQRKTIAWSYLFVFFCMTIFLMCLSLILGGNENDNEVVVWMVIAVVMINIFVFGMVTNALYTRATWKILANTLIWGFFPCIFWSIKGFILSTKMANKGHEGRHAFYCLSKLMFWTLSPTLGIIFGACLFFILVKIGILRKRAEVPVTKQKLHEIIVGEDHFEPSQINDLENPMETSSTNGQSLLSINKSKLCSDECAICWEKFTIGSKLLLVEGCNHTFHRECLRLWAEKDARCPMCRAHIEKIDKESQQQPSQQAHQLIINEQVV